MGFVTRGRLFPAPCRHGQAAQHHVKSQLQEFLSDEANLEGGGRTQLDHISVVVAGFFEAAVRWVRFEYFDRRSACFANSCPQSQFKQGGSTPPHETSLPVDKANVSGRRSRDRMTPRCCLLLNYCSCTSGSFDLWKAFCMTRRRPLLLYFPRTPRADPCRGAGFRSK